MKPKFSEGKILTRGDYSLEIVEHMGCSIPKGYKWKAHHYLCRCPVHGTEMILPQQRLTQFVNKKGMPCDECKKAQRERLKITPVLQEIVRIADGAWI